MIYVVTGLDRLFPVGWVPEASDVLLESEEVLLESDEILLESEGATLSSLDYNYLKV